MLLTEIAVQNVVGFPATARIPLKAGLNALVGREVEFGLLIRAVLYPASDDGLKLAAVATPRKAALTILGRDGHTWRVVRDFDRGRTLLRSDAAGPPVTVAQEEGEVAQALATQVGLPPPEAFRDLFFLQQASLPSQAGTGKSGGKPAALSPTSEETDLRFTADEARQKLPRLKQELVKAVDFEKVQDEVFQLQIRIGELSETTRRVDELQEQISELEQKALAFRRLGEATQGLEQKIRDYPEAQAHREGALAELKRKQAEYERQTVAAPGRAALWKDQMLLGGVGGGLACAALALVLGWAWLWWLVPAGFAVAAFAAWRFVGVVEEAEGGRRRLSDLLEIEKRIEKQYEADTAPVHEAMRLLEAGSPAALSAKLEERDVLEARRVALLRELEEVKSDPQVAGVAQERDGLAAQLAEREALVTSFGFSRDPGAIRREVQVCEEVLGLTSTVDDPLAAPIARAAEATGSQVTDLLRGLGQRLGQYLVALTDRRFVAVEPRESGFNVVAAGGAKGPIGGLSPADRDLVVLGVRLALAERLAGALKLPVLVDEPSVMVDTSHRALFVKMLKALGSSTQVLVRAFEAPPPGVVDHLVAVGRAEKAA